MAKKKGRVATEGARGGNDSIFRKQQANLILFDSNLVWRSFEMLVLSENQTRAACAGYLFLLVGSKCRFLRRFCFLITVRILGQLLRFLGRKQRRGSGREGPIARRRNSGRYRLPRRGHCQRGSRGSRSCDRFANKQRRRRRRGGDCFAGMDNKTCEANDALE